MWLRICVALGVFSGLPAPTGDPLASLHTGFLRCLDGSTEPGMAAGGRLDRTVRFDAAPSMHFTPSALAARYGSNESAGFHLPANVSRNTPAMEAGGL